ncbi:MAG: hypothetical protein IVW52_12825 [Acidimicrobiales bacterium]|nr:hypothetical protein [Acidimicrobiales bacterium]
MPAVTQPHDLYFQNLMDEIRQRLTALEMQQNFGIRDASGLIRAQGGKLPNGDYGFAVTDPSGITTELNPIQSASILTSEGTSSGTPTNLATVGPTLTAHVGASGSALVLLGANIQATSGGAAEMWVAIDGTVQSNPSAQLSTPASVVSASCMGGAVVTGIAPGDHTFQAKYQVGAGPGPATFFDRWLIVQPI